MSQLTGKMLPFKLLVLPLKSNEKTKSGIYIPETDKKPQYRGKVILTGCDVKNVEVNNVVYYGQHAGTYVEIDDINYLVLSENDCLYIEQ